MAERSAQKVLDNLKQTRDELRVQLNLGKAEVRDRWEELEKKLNRLEQRVETSGSDAMNDIEEGAQRLFKEVRRGYDELRTRE